MDWRIKRLLSELSEHGPYLEKNLRGANKEYSADMIRGLVLEAEGLLEEDSPAISPQQLEFWPEELIFND
jgi:hypothetical protein